MFGRPSSIFDLLFKDAFDTDTYLYALRSKLAQLQDIVETNVAQTSHRQQSYYDCPAQLHQFHVGDQVGLSIHNAEKLNPHWEGQWESQSVKGAATSEIIDGSRVRVIHVNRLRHRYQPLNTTAPLVQPCPVHWEPPSVSHEEIMTDSHLPNTAGGILSGEPCYPQRIRYPPTDYVCSSRVATAGGDECRGTHCVCDLSCLSDYN